MNELGIRPEHECFDSGHIANLEPLLDMGVLQPPLQVSCVMGVTGGVRPPRRTSRTWASRSARRAHEWGVIGISRVQWTLVAAALALGGNVRVGLEDNFYLPDGEMARSNGELIARARRLTEDIGRRVATREVLGEQLDRHGALEHGVGGLEDRGHAAGAEPSLDAVAAGDLGGDGHPSPPRHPRRRRRRRPAAAALAVGSGVGRRSGVVAPSPSGGGSVSVAGGSSPSCRSSRSRSVGLRRGLRLGRLRSSHCSSTSSKRRSKLVLSASRTSGSTSSGIESSDLLHAVCSGLRLGDVGAGAAADVEAALDRVELALERGRRVGGIGSPSSSEPQPAASAGRAGERQRSGVRSSPHCPL